MNEPKLNEYGYQSICDPGPDAVSTEDRFTISFFKWEAKAGTTGTKAKWLKKGKAFFRLTGLCKQRNAMFKRADAYLKFMNAGEWNTTKKTETFKP